MKKLLSVVVVTLALMGGGGSLVRSPSTPLIVGGIPQEVTMTP